MKYLEVDSFDQINAALSDIEVGECRVTGRVEAYSCKAAGQDKKLYRSLESKYAEEERDGDTPLVSSPFGPLDQQASRKTLYFLILVLNAAFPDYDFSNVKANQFCKQNYLGMVTNSINTSLANIGFAASGVLDKLWQSIDAEIQLNECDIYLFTPDPDADPYGDGHAVTIWSFHYFFYNKRLKRIIFFTAHSESMIASNETHTDEVAYSYDEGLFFEDGPSDMDVGQSVIMSDPDADESLSGLRRPGNLPALSSVVNVYSPF